MTNCGYVPAINTNRTETPSTSTANREETPSRMPRKNNISNDRRNGEKRPFSNDVDLQILQTLEKLRNGNDKGIATDQIFGNLVAAELGNMQEPERKRQIKRQIIDVLFTE